MSLAKPTWTSKARAEEFACMRNAAGNLRGLAESLLGQLLSFTDQLFQGQPCGNLKWNSPPSIERGMLSYYVAFCFQYYNLLACIIIR